MVSMQMFARTIRESLVCGLIRGVRVGGVPIAYNHNESSSKCVNMCSRAAL